MEVENLIDTLGYLVCSLFGNIVSMFTKLPVYDIVYRWATLPKAIRAGAETMTETANKWTFRSVKFVSRTILI